MESLLLIRIIYLYLIHRIIFVWKTGKHTILLEIILLVNKYFHGSILISQNINSFWKNNRKCFSANQLTTDCVDIHRLGGSNQTIFDLHIQFWCENLLNSSWISIKCNFCNRHAAWTGSFDGDIVAPGGFGDKRSGWFYVSCCQVSRFVVATASIRYNNRSWSATVQERTVDFGATAYFYG